MIKANYHTHTYLCKHAIGTVEDYVQKAVSLGFSELGMSDHGSNDLEYFKKEGIFPDYTVSRMFLYQLPDYIAAVNEAKEKYRDVIRIYRGLECEYFPEDDGFTKMLRDQLEYMVLGVHFYKYKGKAADTFAGLNSENVEGYFETAIAAMETGYFRILAHPDLFMLRYQGLNGYRKMDSLTEAGSRRMIECAIRNGIALEVNCQGINATEKFGVTEGYAYPTKEFFTLLKEYPEAEVVIGADAHFPDLMGSDCVTKAEEFCRELGIRTVKDNLLKII